MGKRPIIAENDILKSLVAPQKVKLIYKLAKSSSKTAQFECSKNLNKMYNNTF